MNNDQRAKKSLPNRGPPRVITIANGIRNTDNNSDDVYDQKYRRRNQQSRPFEDVKLRERSIVCCFDVSVKLDYPTVSLVSKRFRSLLSPYFGGALPDPNPIRLHRKLSLSVLTTP
ncbi:hypothetical protein Bca4012_007027 [Brassica carinata]